MPPATLEPISFDQLQGWENDDHLAAFAAFLPGAQRMQEKPYKTRVLGVDGQVLKSVGRRALNVSSGGPVDGPSARRFFEDEFTPHRLVGNQEKSGLLTGFFEPLVPASRKPSDRFRYPLYRRPADLVDVDGDNRPVAMDATYRFARATPDGIVEYFDRSDVQNGALSNQGLELAWLESKVDAFFIHVQGAAKLQLSDGDVMRVTFAAKSGHPYTSVAKTLCHRLKIPPEEMTADRLADWMFANPEKLDELLAHNRSYIFFKKVEDQLDSEGPIAAAKVPLIAGRSMAVDRTLHTFGCPIWLTTSQPLPEDDEPLARLMMAHDTGSAIVGAERGDLFTGTGRNAGLKAGRIRHSANLFVLVPNQ